MKHPTTLFFALTLLAALTLTLAPAYAALTIQLDKDAYSPGEFLTLTGSGAPPNTPVAIQVIDPTGEIRGVAQVISDATGAFTATNFYKVPAAPTGTWTVKATAAGQTATDTFTIIVDTTPPTIVSITLDKTIVKGGAAITVTVEATDNVGVASVKADNVPLTLVAGKWVGTVTAAQTEGVNTLTVVASDAAGNTATKTATYRVDNTPPTIAHTPVTTATINTPITITATITDNVEVKSATLNYRTKGAAAFTSVPMTAVGDTYTATIPATAVTAAGVEYYIQAADTATNEYKTPTYTVTVAVARFTITPEHAPPGASVSYSGTNFTPNKKYTLTVDWDGITVTLDSGTATAAGTISGTFKVPGLQSRVYTVVAKDEAGITATARFGVEQVSTTELATKIDALSTQLTNVEKTLSTKMDTMQTAITKAITDAQTAITAAISSAQTDIKAAIATTQKAITDEIAETQKAVTDAVSAAQTALASSIQSVDDSLKAAQTALAESAKSVEDAVKAAQSDIKAAISSAQTALSGSISEVKSSVDKLTDTVNNINTGIATTSTFTLIVTALVVITLVIEIVILIRRR
jgi:predicted  nucleic acid-binding Zn-ribbon protein